jgi:hypothetical protein
MGIRSRDFLEHTVLRSRAAKSSLATPPMRCFSDELPKNGREVPLCLKPSIQRYFDKCLGSIHQQALGMLDSLAEYKVVRAVACRGSELAREMHPTQPCRSGKISECDRLRNVCINESENPHEAPKRVRHAFSLTRVGRDGARLCGYHRGSVSQFPLTSVPLKAGPTT